MWFFKAKIIVTFYPNQGVDDIFFGTSRTEVRQILRTKYKQGEPVLRGSDSDCYFENALQFFFVDGTLSFIEVGSPPPVYLRLFDIDTWKISGAELLEQVKKYDEIDANLSEWEVNPIFKKTHITFYELDEQYDTITKGEKPKWGAIGIGDDRYYQSLKVIK